MVKRKSMDAWIREALTDPDKSDKPSMLSLVHMVGQQQKEIHSVNFKGGRSWTEVELANLFRGKAETYSQDLVGVQTFQLLAFYGESTTPQAFFPFVINNVGDNASNGLMTEAPTEQGRLQQVMRQNEMLIQQVYRRQQIMDDYSLRLISQQGSMIEQLQSENRDAFAIVKDMLMQQALATHKHQMEQLKYERSTAERQKLMTMAPQLINTITGKEVFPQAAADTALIESIAEVVSEEHIQMLGMVLPPQLAGTLAQRFSEYNAKKDKERKQLKAISEFESPDPEADAAGEAIEGGSNVRKLKR